MGVSQLHVARPAGRTNASAFSVVRKCGDETVLVHRALRITERNKKKKKRKEKRNEKRNENKK